MDELTICIGRTLASRGRVTSLPISNGHLLDFHLGGSLFAQNAGEAQFSYLLKDEGDFRSITTHYRHPISRKAAITFFRDLGKRCFPAEIKEMTGE